MFPSVPDPPVGYRKVVLPSVVDQLSDSSEEEVFVREDVKRKQQLFIKEKVCMRVYTSSFLHVSIVVYQKFFSFLH